MSPWGAEVFGPFLPVAIESALTDSAQNPEEVIAAAHPVRVDGFAFSTHYRLVALTTRATNN